MFNDVVNPKGQLKIQVTGPNGIVKYEETVKNLVVTTGKEFIAARMSAAGTPTAMSHMAVGTDNTAAAAGDTALGTEVGRVSLSTTTVTDNEVEYVATFGAGTGTGALVEAGILNDVTAGTLLCRTVFSVVNKGADDTLTITWTITIN
jgi:hypothetical protein